MSDPIDLASLNDTERTVLSLLAQGHTAKSIAVEIGRTEGAVNERLREARRKTGVGSSRELARLMRARENRDEQTDGAAASFPAPPPPGTSPPARTRPKVLPMTISLLTIAAAALALHDAGQQPPLPPVPPTPPAAGTMTGAESALRTAFAAEPRDVIWADRAEAALRRRYAAVPGLEASALAVTCHRTLCVAKGRSRDGVGLAVGKRGADELDGLALRQSVPGLHADVTDASSDGEGAAFRYDFDAIWRRTDRG